MTDDLDDLKRLLVKAAPRPDPARREANIAAAKDIFTARQGSRRAARPGLATLWKGARQMLHTMTTKGALTATTALVACGLLLLTPPARSIWPDAPAPAPVTLTEAEVARTTAPQAITAAPQTRAAKTAPETPAPGADAATLSVIADVAAPAMEMAAAPPAMTETFANAPATPVQIVADAPVSTFSIDVDTASYAYVRAALTGGALPSTEAVRVEEMINYFSYDYPAPAAGEAPFRAAVSTFETPWNADTRLVRIGLQGALPAVADRPPLNLVFLIDVSGSMDEPGKLPLLRQSFRLMLSELRPEDEVAIVTYAGNAGEALSPTAASDRDAIAAALDALAAGGSTNGEGGLVRAYALAAEMAREGEVSRVILATDGDFNVGLDDPAALERFIADQRAGGTYLSVLGFGRGNLDDATMQALAQAGNGTAAYIDTLSEARKVLVDQLTGAIYPIADDVKVQVEWNPATVAEYRLIGYETRALSRTDFNNDAVDAGELGAGHQVTALYEITPVGSPAQLSDPLRYQPADAAGVSGELGFLRLRYKDPGGAVSHLLEAPIPVEVAAPDDDARFAAAIAGFGQLLRGDADLGEWSYADAIALATASRGDDPFGYRSEAIGLMRLAESLAR